MDNPLDFEKKGNDTETRAYLIEWNGSEENRGKVALIVFNEKNNSWYIAARDGIMENQIEGKIEDIAYLTSLSELLRKIYDQTSAEDLPSILDKCRQRSSEILEIIKKSLGIIRPLGGEFKFDFKELYNSESISLASVIDGYINGAYQLVALIRDDKFSTLPQKLKVVPIIIFSLRHAIELSVKELMSCIGKRDIDIRHDLNSGWGYIQSELKAKNMLKNIEYDQVTYTLNVLKEWGLDKDEEIFRYRESKDGQYHIDSKSFNLFSFFEQLHSTALYFKRLIMEFHRTKDTEAKQ